MKSSALPIAVAAKPAACINPCRVRRSHLRHKYKSKRRNEELGFCRDEMQNPIITKGVTLIAERASADIELNASFFLQECQREKHQKYVCRRSTHTDTNLHRCRHFFAPLFEKSEEPHDKRCQRNHKRTDLHTEISHA